MNDQHPHIQNSGYLMILGIVFLSFYLALSTISVSCYKDVSSSRIDCYVSSLSNLLVIPGIVFLVVGLYGYFYHKIYHKNTTKKRNKKGR